MYGNMDHFSPSSNFFSPCLPYIHFLISHWSWQDVIFNFHTTPQCFQELYWQQTEKDHSREVMQFSHSIRVLSCLYIFSSLENRKIFETNLLGIKIFNFWIYVLFKTSFCLIDIYWFTHTYLMCIASHVGLHVHGRIVTFPEIRHNLW